VSNISYFNSPPLLLSFILPPLIPGTVSAGIILAFIYTGKSGKSKGISCMGGIQQGKKAKNLSVVDVLTV
jgi:hypothetical protein